jgi:GH35 family endo-1,4-beta-xylanase
MVTARNPNRRPVPPRGEEWLSLDGKHAALRYSSADDAILRKARRGIEEHRKADATLMLTDRQGRPLADTPVEIEQTRHAFPFGDQLWHLDALVRDGRGDGEQARAWKQRFGEMFNAATNLCYWTERPRNDASKSEDRQGEQRLENFAATVDWTLASGMIAKGHPLFWSIPKAVPDWAQRYDTATFMKFVEVRVRNLVARFRGRVTIWDAVNEAIWEAAPKHLAHRAWPHIESIADMVEYVSPVLRWCREEDPDATYLVNDYGTELEDKVPNGNDGSKVTAASQRKRFIALARALQDAGTPPDAIGLQSHTGGWARPSQQWAVYDEYAAGTGLPVHITEYWADTKRLKATGRYTDEEMNAMQARHVCDFLTCAFGHPSVDAFFFGGFMGAAIQWHDSFSSHEAKPVWDAVRHLLHDEWRTRVTVRTDAEGCATFRGFLGDYAVRRALGSTRRGVVFRVSRQAPGPLHLAL